jgi:patatin-like phospholipase/acyl hydrolase
MRRILAIDGGGIKGVFPASFLATIEDTIGATAGDYFDLIVGTSTGGIIALGLGMGMSARDILGFYQGKGPEIFAGSRLTRWLRHWGVGKVRCRPLERGPH